MLRTGETLQDRCGISRTLPSSFLRVDSWSQALETPLIPNFKLWELIGVDVRETPLMRTFPRYVPCAVVLLAGALELFRQEVGTYVHVAANGGYRSPAHALSRHASRHCWGTAANIYRIGDTWRDSRTLFAHALEVTEKNYLAATFLGEVERRKGELESARAHLEQALEANKFHVPAMLELGLTLTELGDLPGARRSLKRTLRNDPANAVAQRALEEVERRSAQGQGAAER